MSAGPSNGPGTAHDPLCLELLERLSEYVDGELEPATRAEIEAHMADCPPCVAFLRSLRHTIGHLSRIPAEELPDELRRACLEAFAKGRGGS